MKKEKRSYTNTKPMKLPVKYRQGFLGDFDQRTGIFILLNTAYQEILADLGGVERLTHIQVALVERFVFLEFMMKYLEKQIAENPKKTRALLSRWIQAINSLSGLAKALGLQRRAKHIDSNLKSYMAGKKRK